MLMRVDGKTPAVPRFGEAHHLRADLPLDLHGEVAVLPIYPQHFQGRERERIGRLLPGKRAGNTNRHLTLLPVGQVHAQQQPIAVLGVSIAARRCRILVVIAVSVLVNFDDLGQIQLSQVEL